MLWNRKYLCVPIVAAALASMISTAPALADDTGLNNVEGLVAHIEQVAPDGTNVVDATRTNEGAVASANGIDAVVSTVATEGVSVSIGKEGFPSEVTLSLPDASNLRSGVLADNGTVVFEDSSPSADAVAVQTLTDGSTRIQTVLATPASPHTFAYEMMGFQPALTPTGEAVFINEAGAFVPVATPWAVDANGKQVQTHYELRGAELVQVVVPTADTTYPVVADPSWQWINAGWGMKLNRSETSGVRNWAAASGMCVAFTRSAPALAIGCGAYSSYMQLQANLAEGDRPRTCLFLNVVPAPGSIWRVTC